MHWKDKKGFNSLNPLSWFLITKNRQTREYETRHQQDELNSFRKSRQNVGGKCNKIVENLCDLRVGLVYSWVDVIKGSLFRSDATFRKNWIYYQFYG